MWFSLNITEKSLTFAAKNYLKVKENILDMIRQSLLLNLPEGGKALLFGSRARGDADDSSDWDVLILLNKERLAPEDYDTISYPLRLLGWDLGEMINPVMYTNLEWENNKMTPFYYNFTNDAVQLV